MEEVRSFIAIELPEPVRLELGQLEARLKAGRQPWVRWVDPGSIHLTLKFLGNISINRVGEVTSVMEEAARGMPPFQLKVGSLGVFPNWKRVQVAWVGMSGELDKLGQLQQRLESGLARLGFPAEGRAFTPHLTIARLSNRASPNERQQFGQLLASNRFESVHRIDVDAISLMRSQLTREGAIYSRLSLVRLAEHQTR